VILQGSNAKYHVGSKVAETNAYRIYLCEDAETGQQFMLQIATEVEHSGGLDRAAYILRKLRVTAEEFETIHAEQGGARLLSYERLFPVLVDSFVPDDQGRRRVNILAFSEVDDITQMVPLSNLTTKDHLRVDLRSSAWILGRLLKLLAFAHGEGITVHTLSGGNVLLEPSRHFAVVFDWSSAQTHPLEKAPRESRKDDVENAAKTVFVALGGNPLTGDYPYLNEADDNDRRYIKLITSMVQRREGNAERAHQQLYSLLDEIYGRTFHPFTTLPL
jgi:hypothetical protein